MPRYIDADALMAQLNRKKAEPCNKRYTEGFNDALMRFRSMVHSAPTVSAGVVHCRECDLWNRWDSAGRESLGNLTCSCAHWTVEDGAAIRTKPTDFCSYGERMVSEDA